MADVKTLTDANFDSEIADAALPMIVDFWAPSCGPCRMVGPVVEEIAGDHADKVVVGKVNVNENPAIASKFGIIEHPHDHPLQGRPGGQEGDQGAAQGRSRARVRAGLTHPTEESRTARGTMLPRRGASAAGIRPEHEDRGPAATLPGPRSSFPPPARTGDASPLPT